MPRPLSPVKGRAASLILFALPACGSDVVAPTGEVGVIARAPGRGGSDGDRPLGLTEGPKAWRFVEVSRAAGLDYTTHYSATEATPKTPLASQLLVAVSGAASGDFDGDGFPDLYVTTGDGGANLLLRNRGDGTFSDVTAAAGASFPGSRGAGPVFGDIDGDGWLDLFIGGIEDTLPRLLLNRHDGTFRDATADSGLGAERVVVTSTLGDYDRDGNLDLATGRWGAGPNREHLFRGDGKGHFTPAGRAAGLTTFGPHNALPGDFSFTANFVDIDDDGRPDLLWSSDYGTTQYFMNRSTPGKDAFDLMHPAFLTDRNGMGSAIGDFDNDGRLDWYVTSIFNPTIEIPPQVGNRLYRNTGGGQFEDVSDKAGVHKGFWAWGTCFADLNNDGWLDLFMVNGFNGRPGSEESLFSADPSRLFVNNTDGTFSERSVALGIDDRHQGRGLVCFDYDNDGDIDLFIANSEEPPGLYRNSASATGAHWLQIKLAGKAPNTEAIGARLYLTSQGPGGPLTQLRELRAGSNYASQDPALAHFGLGKATRVDKLRIVWPDGSETVQSDLAVDARITVTQP